MCFCGACALSDSMRIQKLLKLLVRHRPEVHVHRLVPLLRRIFAHIDKRRERFVLLVIFPRARRFIEDIQLHAVAAALAVNRHARLGAEPHADEVRAQEVSIRWICWYFAQYAAAAFRRPCRK